MAFNSIRPQLYVEQLYVRVLVIREKKEKGIEEKMQETRGWIAAEFRAHVLLKLLHS